MTKKKLTGNEPLTLRDLEILRAAFRGRVRLAHSGKTMLDPVHKTNWTVPVDMAALLAHHLVDPVQRGDYYRPNAAGRRRIEEEDARPSEYPTPTSEGTR